MVYPVGDGQDVIDQVRSGKGIAYVMAIQGERGDAAIKFEQGVGKPR